MFARPLDLGLGHPDQSNAPEAFWRSGSIREFGLGLFTHGFSLFYVFLVFLLCLPPVLAIWTFMCFNFLSKIPKKLLYVPEAFLYYFVMLLHVKIDKKCVHLFYTFVYFCVFTWWVSCIIVDLNSCHIMLIGTWFYDFIPSDSVIAHLILARLILFCFV